MIPLGRSALAQRPPAYGTIYAATGAGDLETARRLARRNIDAFEGFLAADRSATIIINADGCGALLKEYGELLKDEPEYAGRAKRFSESVRDVTEFLAQGGFDLAPRSNSASLTTRPAISTTPNL